MIIRTNIRRFLFEESETPSADGGIVVSPEQMEGISSVLFSLGLNPEPLFSETPTDEQENVFDSTGQDPLFLNGQQQTEAKNKNKNFLLDEEAGLPTKNHNDISLHISPEAIENAKRFFELGKKAGNWYFEANATLRAAFSGNEQDLVLFCMLLAATSVQNEIYTNFIEAVVLYNAIHRDIINRPNLLRKFANDVGGGQMGIAAGRAYYSGLSLFKDADAIKIMSGSAKFVNIAKVLKLWADSPDGLTVDKARTALVNSLVPRNISKAELMKLSPEQMFKPTSPFIGKMKIANYALTLLDPTFASSDKNPFNVVVDTWMWRVFFPDHLSKGMNGDLSAKILNKLFSSKKHYETVASMVSQLAGEAGVAPHVMQAAIWTGIKMEWEGEHQEGETNYDATISSLILKYGEIFGKFEEEANKLAEIIKRLDTSTAADDIRQRRVAHIVGIVNRNTEKRRLARQQAAPDPQLDLF